MSETHCITIQIVGTVQAGGRFQEQLSALFERLQALLPEVMPDVVLANPPATVTTFELFDTIPAKRVDWKLSQAESELIKAARIASDAISGDGNGHCTIEAGAADRLRRAIEQWEKMP
jgi:hypothetical protein